MSALSESPESFPRTGLLRTVRRKTTGAISRRNWLLASLVALPIIAIPFENQYSLFGFSLAKLTIVPVSIVVVLMHPTRLANALKQAPIIVGLLFVLWGVLVESFHPNSDYDYVFRVLQMLVFAALIAVAVRSRAVYSRVLVLLACVCFMIAGYLILNFYGLVDVGSVDFKTASSIRQQAFSEMSLQANLNVLAYTVALGAVIATARALDSTSLYARIAWCVVLLSCAIGAMVPASRGAFLGLVCGCGVTVWRSVKGTKNRSSILLLVAVAILVFLLIPASLTTRLSSSGRRADVTAQKQEGRVRVYTAALETFPKYWGFGIGIGEYFDGWSRENGFDGLGPHNGFLAAWMFFGLPAFVLLCTLCVLVGFRYRSVQSGWWGGRALFGLLVLGLFWMMFTHDLYLKQFGLLLGLLIGAPLLPAMSRRNLKNAARRFAGFSHQQSEPEGQSGQPVRLRRRFVPSM